MSKAPWKPEPLPLVLELGGNVEEMDEEEIRWRSLVDCFFEGEVLAEEDKTFVLSYPDSLPLEEDIALRKDYKIALAIRMGLSHLAREFNRALRRMETKILDEMKGTKSNTAE